MGFTENKRHQYVMKDFFVPIIAALILGIGASFLTVKYNQGETSAWRSNIEMQIESLKVIMKAVQINQIELAARGQWMKSIEGEMDGIQKRIGVIESNRYTSKMANKHETAILREIDLLRTEVRSN